MLVIFCINLVKIKSVWLLRKRDLYSFWDGRSTIIHGRVELPLVARQGASRRQRQRWHRRESSMPSLL